MTKSPAENEATGTEVTGNLGDTEIGVPPVKQWRASALDALTEGRFSAWAELVLSDEAYDAWIAADPTIGEVEEFFESIGDKIGMGSPGESRASRRSSRSTRKR